MQTYNILKIIRKIGLMSFNFLVSCQIIDVEEFMLILFNKVFKLDEFIVYDTGVKDYLHQINLGDHILPNVITVKRCLELSMADYKLKLESLPKPALILEIPRNSESVIQSTTIVPNLTLDISDLVKSISS